MYLWTWNLANANKHLYNKSLTNLNVPLTLNKLKFVTELPKFAAKAMDRPCLDHG